MRKIQMIILHFIYAFIIFVLANMVSLKNVCPIKGFMITICIMVFVIIHIMPSVFNKAIQTKSLRNSKNGCELLRLFLLSTVFSIVYSIFGWIGILPLDSLKADPKMWVINTLIVILVEASVFWNGMIRIYLTSKQLGMRWRVIGAVCGMIPVVNLIVLFKLIRVVEKEVKVENEKLLLNQERSGEHICKTKYPILMVHGVFFRDFRYLNYWGRIPKELEQNGATVFYGNHHSATSVEESAKELTARIKQIVEETKCEKVNIIAHSKGGLDCRYAIAMTGAAPYVASLTTINTPHRGCEFADYLLSKIPKVQQESIATAYNGAVKKLGDTNPNFMEAVYDLTTSACEARNEIVKDVKGIYYQSIGSKQNCAANGRFPLNFTYQLVHYFDGCNDGLVGEKSFPWGENYQCLTVQGKRGISHADMIDLCRENLDEFDVREFYVQLVKKLKNKGF